MESKKLILVYAPPEEGTEPLYSTGWCVPLGNLSISTYASQSGFSVELLDSAVLDYAEIEQRIKDCDNQTLVGFSTTIFNMKPSVKLASIAKKKDASVLFGGVQASHLAKNVLSSLPEVDYVVVGEGELPTLELLKGTKLPEIGNLVYRVEGGILANSVGSKQVWRLFQPDRSLLDYQERYKSNWRSMNETKPFTATNVYFQRGCDWGRCSFCTEPKGTTNSPLKDYFAHLRKLRDEYGFNGFFEVSPGPSGKTLESLLEARPADLEDTCFRFYTYPHILTDRIINVLEELNTWEVFIGVESGNVDILRQSAAIKVEVGRIQSEGKKYDVSRYHEGLVRSVEKLGRKGIAVKTSYIVGLEGETEESLRQTESYARNLVEAGAASLACSILLPLPGTKVFRQIMQHPVLGPKYNTKGIFDIEELRHDWVDNFCHVSTKEVQDAQERILSMLPNATGVARKSKAS